MSSANIRSETQGLTRQDIHQRTLTVYQGHWLPTASDQEDTVAEKSSGPILECGE